MSVTMRAVIKSPSQVPQAAAFIMLKDKKDGFWPRAISKYPCSLKSFMNKKAWFHSFRFIDIILQFLLVSRVRTFYFCHSKNVCISQGWKIWNSRPVFTEKSTNRNGTDKKNKPVNLKLYCFSFCRGIKLFKKLRNFDFLWPLGAFCGTDSLL